MDKQRKLRIIIIVRTPILHYEKSGERKERKRVRVESEKAEEVEYQLSVVPSKSSVDVNREGRSEIYGGDAQPRRECLESSVSHLNRNPHFSLRFRRESNSANTTKLRDGEFRARRGKR